MLKVMTIVGTRPELIKMSRVIAELDRCTHHILVHTGQNYDYELNQIFFEDLEIRKPDYFLEASGGNAIQTISQILVKADEVLDKESPDALMLYGDTNSCLSVLAAKRRKIPIFHMEAGNRCFDQRVPEELNRKVVDHLSDINMVLTEHARRYLLAEGLRPEMIFKTGSHMPEVLAYYKEKIESSTILEKLGLEFRQYFLVSAHREENVDSEETLKDLIYTLECLVHEYNLPVIFSTHPRTRKNLESLGFDKFNSKIVFSKPFGFCDYISLQKNALCILSDSGTITEEAALLNLPAVTIRNTHERPEGMDSGILVMSGLKHDRVIDSVKATISHAQLYEKQQQSMSISDYNNLNVAQQVAKIVLSYVNYVNRVVWSKVI